MSRLRKDSVARDVRRSGRGVEGVPEHLDDLPAMLQMNRHDVEATRRARQPMPRNVIHRETHDATALEPVNGFRGWTETAVPPRLHLHEHHGSAITRHDVQFSTAATVPASKNRVPSALQLVTRQIFPGFAQSDASIRHGYAWQQGVRQSAAGSSDSTG